MEIIVDDIWYPNVRQAEVYLGIPRSLGMAVRARRQFYTRQSDGRRFKLDYLKE